MNRSSALQQRHDYDSPQFASSRGRKRRRTPTVFLGRIIRVATATTVMMCCVVTTTTMLGIDAFTLSHPRALSKDAVTMPSSSLFFSSTPLDIPSTTAIDVPNRFQTTPTAGTGNGKIITSSSQQHLNKVNRKPLPTTTFDMSQPQRRSLKSTKWQQPNARLSVQEQLELFRHVVEVRRIRKVELQLEQEYFYSSINSESQRVHVEPIVYDKPSKGASIHTGTVTMLELAKKTGYGNDIQELETSLILGQQTRDKLITTNMGLVHYCVQDILKHRTLRSITMEDLIQEGAIGLSRAVDKYNPPAIVYPVSKEEGRYDSSSSKITSSLSTATIQSGGAKFSTYAVYWIRAAMLRTISERDDIMRVPEHVTTAIRKISNVAHARGYQWERGNSSYDNYDKYQHIEDLSTFSTTASKKGTVVEDDIEQASSSSSSVYWLNDDRQNPQEEDMARMIADETGYSDRMVQSAMMVQNRRNKYSSTVLSYESWMQQGKHYETDNSNFIQQSSSPLTWDEPTPNMEHMKQTLSRFLRPKEMEALSWRYGLNDQDDVNSKSERNTNPLAKRDYLAQAEMELFGSTTTTKEMPKKSTNEVVKGKWGEAMSFNDVGKQMQVSAEYGRRLCHAALQKLRRAVDDGKLEPALLF